MLDYVPDCYETQEMREKAVSKEPFMLKYCLDKYKSQEMCKKMLMPGLNKLCAR